MRASVTYGALFAITMLGSACTFGADDTDSFGTAPPMTSPPVGGSGDATTTGDSSGNGNGNGSSSGGMPSTGLADSSTGPAMTTGCPTAGCPTAGGFCGLTCESPADCAMGGNAADWECNDGFCEYVAAPLPCDNMTCPAAIGLACANVDGNNICVFTCTDGGGECDVAMLECTGTDDAGNSFCQGAPCGGVAEGEACEIPMFGELGTCTDGVCSCNSNDECTAEGYACNQ